MSGDTPRLPYGYQVNATKTWLITKEQYYETASSTFSGTQVNITKEGKVHLGAALGTQEYIDQFVKRKVSEWCSEVEKLARIAETQPRAAYAAVTHGLIGKWNYLKYFLDPPQPSPCDYNHFIQETSCDNDGDVNNPHPVESTQDGGTTKEEPQENGMKPNERRDQEPKNQGLIDKFKRRFSGSDNKSQASQGSVAMNVDNPIFEEADEHMRATPAIFGAKEPEWDIESEKCYACNAIIESRNNCRACGKVVCNECSKNKAHLQYIGNTVMVCPHCHKESEKKGD